MNIEQIIQAKHDLFYVDGTFRFKDIHDYTQTIQFALNLAHKVMSEPSEGMIDAGEEVGRKVPFVDYLFKEMINAAIEEVGNE